MATQALLRLTEAFPDGVPALCPVRHLRITDLEFVQTRDERESLEATMDCYNCSRCPQFREHVSRRNSLDNESASFSLRVCVFLQFRVAQKRTELWEKQSDLKFMLSEESLQMLPEYNQRIEVCTHKHCVSVTQYMYMPVHIAYSHCLESKLKQCLCKFSHIMVTQCIYM